MTTDSINFSRRIIVKLLDKSLHIRARAGKTGKSETEVVLGVGVLEVSAYG